MRRNETLVHLAGIMKKCNELELPCKRAIDHYGSCVNEMADDIIGLVNRLLAKPEIRSCRIPLVIDFDKMTKADYWLDCKLFSERYPDMTLNDWRHIIETYTPMVRNTSKSNAKEISIRQYDMAAESDNDEE